ncbi:12326_t:CDS:2 [Ambispora gerdemannii]|uniref:12326_t:CDS:1 n=1 Tax=Ambispora gerdemannii TaxID=144530 RepID=A0A9N9AE44_9GLOM|nr:12326_t:CDS:2 [Ambispora gerdemannii]
MQIPLTPAHFSKINTGGLEGLSENKRSMQSTTEECTELYLRLLSQIIYPPSYGTNEDSYHAFWDVIIKNSLEMFGKNILNKEFTGRNCPDMVTLVKNVCPFHGEKSVDSTEDPSQELTKKFKGWTYGDSSYLFGYYATGKLVTFVTLSESVEDGSSKKRK